ncbi:hypothetical protein LIER_42113 [Lithospermum erythrorhizon]|uniref:RING-type domain-containing protein n=1 Tax=Lithospermum erythrorhizon TaxID=34254 RepID=A0AAV3RNE8_LITER
MNIVMSVFLLLCGIGVLILVHNCVVRRRIRLAIISNNGGPERGSLASSSMSLEDIEKLPSFRYKENIITTNNKEERMKGDFGNSKECAVCLENLEVGDKCRLLPICKHSFHADCVDVWLLKSIRCPICRSSAENSNRELHFDEEIVGFQSDEIIVQESENNDQEIVVPIELSEIEEVEDVHQCQDVIEMKEDNPKDVTISAEILK